MIQANTCWLIARACGVGLHMRSVESWKKCNAANTPCRAGGLVSRVLVTRVARRNATWPSPTNIDTDREPCTVWLRMPNSVCITAGTETWLPLLNVPTDSSSQPLRGVILCCTSVPPEKRVSDEVTLGPPNQMWLTCTWYAVRVGISSGADGRGAQGRPDIRRDAPDCWRH